VLELIYIYRSPQVRFNTIVAIFSSSLAFYLVYGPEERDTADIGFTLAVRTNLSRQYDIAMRGQPDSVIIFLLLSL
jgi:hypothetical protein